MHTFDELENNCQKDSKKAGGKVFQAQEAASWQDCGLLCLNLNSVLKNFLKILKKCQNRIVI